MGRSSAPRVLCACEESQAVTERLRKMGIEAYSCDLQPTSGRHPEWHIQADALQVAKLAWDAVLAFPPCTNLAVSGARWFDEKRRDGRQQMGIGFFLAFTALDWVPHVAIENPIGPRPRACGSRACPSSGPRTMCMRPWRRCQTQRSTGYTACRQAHSAGCSGARHTPA